MSAQGKALMFKCLSCFDPSTPNWNYWSRIELTHSCHRLSSSYTAQRKKDHMKRQQIQLFISLFGNIHLLRWLWCLNFSSCLFWLQRTEFPFGTSSSFPYSWRKSNSTALHRLFFFHSHLWSLLCSFFSLYLISPPCLLLCYRPVWLTGLRSAFSQRREDRLCSNWRYRNAIFQCCGTWFTLYFHLTCVELVSLWWWSHFICIDKSPEAFHYLKNLCQGCTDSNLALDPREISEKSTP